MAIFAPGGSISCTPGALGSSSAPDPVQGHQRLAIRGSALAAGRCASSLVGSLAPKAARSE